MFGYEDKRPYHIQTSKQNFEKHVDLLQLSNSKISCYLLIKIFDRFMINKTRHHGKNIFVNIVYNGFLAETYYKRTKIVLQLTTRKSFLPEKRCTC